MTCVADANELGWYVSAAVLPSDLQTCRNGINQYPKRLTAAQLLRMQARRRALSSDAASDLSDEGQPKRRAGKRKEEVQYKSARSIDDSDAELGDDEASLAKEAVLRARTAGAVREERPGTMEAAGTKKRGEGEGGERKRWKRAAAGANGDDAGSDEPGARPAGRSSATAGTKKRKKTGEGEGGERKRWRGAAADDADSDEPGGGRGDRAQRRTSRGHGRSPVGRRRLAMWRCKAAKSVRSDDEV